MFVSRRRFIYAHVSQVSKVNKLTHRASYVSGIMPEAFLRVSSQIEGCHTASHCLAQCNTTLWLIQVAHLVGAKPVLRTLCGDKCTCDNTGQNCVVLAVVSKIAMGMIKYNAQQGHKQTQTTVQYCKDQNVHEMQCQALLEVQIAHCYKVYWIVSNQGKATQPRASASRSKLVHRCKVQDMSKRLMQTL